MKKTLIIGLMLFIVFVIAMAPASLLQRGTAAVEGLDLTRPAGTIWRGTGEIAIDRRPIGSLRWTFQPMSIFTLSPGYDVEFEGDGLRLSGTINASGGVQISIAGSIETRIFNPYLSVYDLFLDGELSISTLEATFSDGEITRMDGAARWSGGSVRYVLGGRLSATDLPPLVASVHSNPIPTADVFPEGGHVPLLHLQILPTGYVKIGVTKSLTKMLNNPWPGTDPDHAVVLEVEEKIF
jgi:hypothetical protein